MMLIVSAMVSAAGAAACIMPGYVTALAIISLALFGHQSFSSNMHTAITEALTRFHRDQPLRAGISHGFERK